MTTRTQDPVARPPARRARQARKYRVLLAGRVAIIVMFIAAVIIASLALAGCSSGPSQASCKHALKAQYTAAVQHGTKASGEPAACKGLPASVLKKLAGEVIAEELGR